MRKLVLLFGILMLFCLTVKCQVDLNNGLVAYYPFNGNVNDASKNNNNGVNYGASLTTDRFGNTNKAYSFDGSSSYILTPVKSGFTTQISLCAWFKNSYNNYGGILNSRTANYLANDLTTDTNGNPSFHLSDGIVANQPNTCMSTTCDLNNNNWHLLIGTYDGSIIRIYVDGLLRNQVFNIFNIAVNAFFYIGFDNLSGYYRYFNGKIDDVRIYNRAINDQEVSAIFYEANPATSTSNISTTNIVITSNSLNNSIIVSGVAENSNISIFEVNGRLIQNGKLDHNQLNVSYIQKGIYLIKLETSSGIVTRKIVL
jgi:hypothetical protein